MIPRLSRLYLRMALYIGAAIAGFVLLGLASLVLVASKQLENYLVAREGSLGRDAAQVLADGGTPALQRWMTTPGTLPDGVALYVLDGGGVTSRVGHCRPGMRPSSIGSCSQRSVTRTIFLGRSDSRLF